MEKVDKGWLMIIMIGVSGWMCILELVHQGSPR